MEDETPANMEVNNNSDDEGSNAIHEEEDGGIRVCDIYIPPPPLPACTFDTSGPRLMITYIENINFKSYAGHQVLGLFDKNFTAIVGPNGSGKSNVIDAMLFVFGYRAQKIRSKKVGVLIHNSDDHSNLQSCTVKVHFQMIIDKGPDKYDVVPNSRFCIARTAFKDNSSYYEIDGKRVPFKEVGKLLRSYGIDLDHNRFLILQGEIEMIAMMKPKGTENDTGMLEYLEDIVGCNRFIEPIKQLNEKYESLNELRNDKINRLKNIEKEKDDVEKAKNEALNYLRLENKIVILENSVLQVKLRQAEINCNEAVAIRDAAKKAFADLEREQEAVKAERSLKEKAYNEVRKESERCVANADECIEKYNELERNDVTCRDSVTNVRKKLKEMAAALEAEETKIKECDKQIAVHEGELSELVKKKDVMEQKKEAEEAKLNEVMASMKEETHGLQQEKQKHESQLVGLKKIANEIKAEVDMAQSELDIYVSNERNEQARLEELEKDYETAKHSLECKQKLQAQAEVNIPVLEEKLKAAQNMLPGLIKRDEELSSEIKVKRSKIEEIKSSMSASKNQSAVVQSLLEQKQCGNIPGIFGRLGDLGAIDEKYDIAISTACGSLDNIVTDTITTAQKCVEYLKRNNKGYATFIALDKMDKWIPYTTQKFSAPENVPRLYDLVRVKDKRVLPAFYFALRNTLVTRDLEQATRIGLHGQTRYRCVTLRGDIIEQYGTMSGGGNRPLKGRMGKSVAAADISIGSLENMVKELDNLIKESSSLHQEKINVEEAIARSQKELVLLQRDLKKNALEFEALKENMKTLSKQIQLQKPRIAAAATDPAVVKQLQTKIDEKMKKFEKADKNASEVQERVNNIHSEILKITKGKYGAVQRTVTKLTKEIDTIEGNITKCKVAVKTATRNKKKSRDKLASINEETKQAHQLQEELLKEYKQLEAEAMRLMELKTAAEEEKQKWEEKRKEMQEMLADVKERELKLKSDHIELKNKLKTEEACVKEKANIVKDFTYKLGKLKLHKIEDDEEDPSLPKLSVAELDEISTNALTYEIGAVEAEMAKLKPNMAAIKEFQIKEQLYKKNLAEVEDVTSKRDEVRKCYDSLKAQRLSEFMAGFKLISSKLKEVYQMITLGGDAELELVDSLDPFTEGVVFSVRPPKKSWKNITNLSGGEKTLSSLALVFALHYYKPTPFYVMDEIDAALDFKNVSIVGNYIKERTKNAQFIIISLRNNMFELADRLVGIFKVYNCTKSCTISPEEISFGYLDEEVENDHENSSLNGPVPMDIAVGGIN